MYKKELNHFIENLNENKEKFSVHGSVRENKAINYV
jgi:hypothetical protein